MLEDEMLEIVFQGEVFGRFVVVVTGVAVALLWGCLLYTSDAADE